MDSGRSQHMQTFRSNVDGWFIALAAVVIAVGIAGAIAAATAGTRLLPVIVAIPAIALVIWIWRSTRYVITDTSLQVRSALLNVAVPLRDITRLRRTSTALSAPALSLDRLAVEYGGGAIVISPAERDQFVAAITSRNPLVDVEGVHAPTAEGETQRRRQARTLALALTGVVILVFGLVVALHLVELTPPRVMVTTAGMIVESGPARIAVVPEAITSLTLEETLPPLRKRVGWGSYTSLRGRFSTDEAAGWVHVARRRPPFIVLRTAQSFLILNDSDPARTKATYEAIVQRWPALRR